MRFGMRSRIRHATAGDCLRRPANSPSKRAEISRQRTEDGAHESNVTRGNCSKTRDPSPEAGHTSCTQRRRGAISARRNLANRPIARRVAQRRAHRRRRPTSPSRRRSIAARSAASLDAAASGRRRVSLRPPPRRSAPPAARPRWPVADRPLGRLALTGLPPAAATLPTRQGMAGRRRNRGTAGQFPGSFDPCR